MASDIISEVMKKMGSRGGKTTAKRHGKKHYQQLAKHMNEVRRQKKLKAAK